MQDELVVHIQEKYPHIFSMQVQRSDQIEFEWYKSGYENKIRTTRSLTKSVLSTLYGIALYQGHLKTLDERVLSFLPECRSQRVDSQLGKVTIRHLLTMTSGLDCTDRRSRGFFKSSNWTKFYIERPILHQPGERFQYSSAGSHLLSKLLYKITGLNVYDFAKTYLFSPLGIRNSRWSHDKQGYYHGGFGLDLSPKDITKIGRLYLHGGIVDNKRLLSEDFIQEATRKQVAGGFPENDGYGMHWWVGSKGSTDYYYAAGLGGQYLFVVPSLGMLVTITSDSRKPHIENKALFTDYVLSNY